jgi:glucose dehydrogenase
MNGKVIGTIVTVKYDQDYENYTIEYFTQDYTGKKLRITDDNFKGCKEKWEFKIGDNLYSLD